MEGPRPRIPCPSCGFMNEPGDSFCGSCRRALEPAAASALPAAGAKTPAAANAACPKCGFMNEPDDLFCGSCRSPLSEAAAAAAATTAAATAPLKPGEVACPSCGTPNTQTRMFCVKCATQLRAEALPPQKQPFRVHRGMVLPFVLSAVIGLGAAVGGARLGSIVLARAPQPTGAPGTPIVVPGPGGDPIGFELTPSTPKPVEPLPDNATIRLIDYKVPTPSEANDPDHRSPWWSDTIPRVPAITQFDGGPLQKSNCVMAAGAMLAELAFGVVTTASELRRHQNDQDGASSYGDLNEAMQRMFGVGFLRGMVSPLQLRALSFAGAGLVVSLNYGQISPEVRVQATFVGNHSVYIDAFTTQGPDGRPAYWVMDPIGHSPGYRGGWWPAEEVERAGLARLGTGKIYASWAFAGGLVPDRPKVLPPEAYPSATSVPGQPTAGPTEPGEPDETANPLPTGDPTPPEDPDTGDDPPEIPAFIGPISINTNVYLIEPKPEGLACTTTPVPAGCPGGIIGVIGPGGANDPTAPPINTIDVLYGTVIAPGTVQIVFDAPAGTTGQLWTWSGAGLPLIQTIAVPAVIGSSTVSVANITVDASGTLSFFATATSSTYSGFSTVGTLVVGG